MICILHGYLLEGSGSNLWTRAVVEALCRVGRSVHLVCQEPHPEDYEFIAAAYLYEPDGTATTLFERVTPYAGACILHRPRLGDTLPVYVPDHYDDFARAVPMVELPDAEIEAYLARNLAVVERVVREHGVTVLHANHAVLMSVVAERLSAATGVPYAVMPHGSALEYAVRRDARFHALAAGAFAEAARIFVVGREMARRVSAIFPDLEGLAEKMAALPLGVDTAAFDLAERDARGARAEALIAALEGLPRGKAPESSAVLAAGLRPGMTHEALASLLAAGRGYAEKRPDAGLEARLGTVDWQADEILLFVGRLIAAKGPQSVIAALPRIFAARPRARLIVVGHGPQREIMEALLWALENGAAALAETIADHGEALEGTAVEPFEAVRLFFRALEARGELDAYFKTARRVIRRERVLFTGYLTHRELKHLFPCCDVAVFASVVPEAGPLVFLEAMAAGCFPLGIDQAGLAERIETAAEVLPPPAAALMKLGPDPAKTIGDIARNAAAALALGGAHKAALRRVAVQRHDWASVAARLTGELDDLTG